MADVVVVDPGELGELLATLLGQYGIRAFHARTGESALEITMHETPAICIIDYELPDASGLDLADLLRSELNTKVILTYSQAHSATAPFESFPARVAAMDAAFARPFRSLTLIEATSRLLGRPLRGQPADAVAEIVTDPAAAVPDGHSDVPLPHALRTVAPNDADELDFKIDITAVEAEPTSGVTALSALGAVEIDDDDEDTSDDPPRGLGPTAPLVDVIRPARVLAPTDLASLWGKLKESPSTIERAPAPPVVAHEGQLTPRTLAELLDAFHQAQAQGQIWLTKDDARRVLMIERGNVVGARSNVAGENIWSLAHRRKAIDDVTLRTLRNDVETQTAGTFAEAVIRARAMTQPALRMLIDEHVRRIALRAFTWHSGGYRVALNARVHGDGIPARLTIADAIVRGIVLTETIDGLRAAAPDDARFAPAPDSPYGLDQVTLTGDEARIVIAMDGTKTLGDLATLFDTVPERTMRGLAAGLLCIGLVRFAGFGPAAARRIAFF